MLLFDTCMCAAGSEICLKCLCVNILFTVVNASELIRRHTRLVIEFPIGIGDATTYFQMSQFVTRMPC